MQRIAQAAREERDYPVRVEWLTILRDNLRAQAAGYVGLADELDAMVAAAPSREAPQLTQLPDLLRAAGGYILWERAVPHGTLKSDFFSAREASGRPMIFRGQIHGIPVITHAMVDGWVREGRLQAEPPGPNANVVFRPRPSAVVR